MNIRNNYHHTLYASYCGYITQAIVNMLAPLLFLTFQKTYEISLEQLAFLVTMNFGTQLLVDLLAAKFVDRIGYRTAVVGAHLFVFTGLWGLSLFPDLFHNHYAGLCLAIGIYGIGGGLIEVMLSPIVQACPTKEKSAAMCLLHSFNCWGQVLVILLSTVFFTVAGIAQWRILVRIWACIPFFNAIYFSQVPIHSLNEEEAGLPLKRLLRMKVFWTFLVLMVCSGASEQAISQWTSAFAESGLMVSKTVGDLAGLCMFSLMMGVSRMFYARHSEKIDLQAYILGSSILCVGGYLWTVLIPNPFLSLAGCGICGLSIGILWPGIFSMAARRCPSGGTALFALLALGGDLGCSLGPAVVGVASSLAGDSLKMGILCAAVFPLLLTGLGIYLHIKPAVKKAESPQVTCIHSGEEFHTGSES